MLFTDAPIFWNIHQTRSHCSSSES